MENGFSRAIKELLPKLRDSNEREFTDAFLNQVIMPFLEKKVGLVLANAKLERRIKKGRYDLKIGNLIIEFEPPLKGIDPGIEQAKRYVGEFREIGKSVRCFVTDGDLAVFIDEQGNQGQIKNLRDVIHEFRAELLALALQPVESEDLLRVLSPQSEIGQSHIRAIYRIFKEKKSSPFINESFDVWRRVYGAASNLTSDVEVVVKKFGWSLDIDLKTRSDVEEFLFVVETYLAILMKLLVAGVARERGVVAAPSLVELLHYPLVDFQKLAVKIPFLRRTFEHDAFVWFVPPTEFDKRGEQKIASVISGIAEVLDKIELSEIRIDILRRIYQEYFTPVMRKALGEFYTKEELVEEVLDTVLYTGEHILDQTLLDPACGSGTFLIAAIRRFIKAGRKKRLSNAEILDRISEQIQGIDIHPFAVAMAQVNYLLAISELIDPSVRRTIGEFEIPVFWTDSLASFIERPDPTGVPIVEVDVAPLGQFFLPERSANWNRLFRVLRMAINNKWDADRFRQEFPSEIWSKYEHTLKTLFGEFSKREEQKRNGRWISTLQNVTVVDSLRARCHFVVGNPPWVRFENVDEQLKNKVEKRFVFYGKKADWKPSLKRIKIALRRHVDYSLAFVESGLSYLQKNGHLGFVITSNVIRSLYAGKMRETLLQETTLLRIADYSLSKVRLFEDAQNAPLILALKKKKPYKNHTLPIEIVNRLEEKRDWRMKQRNLPLVVQNPASPWSLVPPKVMNALRTMQEAGKMIGDVLAAREGIITAANNVYFVTSILGETDELGVIRVKTKGGEMVRIEEELVRPLVKGDDIDDWNYRTKGYIFWPHDDQGKVFTDLPPYARRYFANHEKELKERKRWQVASLIKKGSPYWVIGDAEKMGVKETVAWQKIDKVLNTTCLTLRHDRLILSGNLYYLETPEEKLGYIIAGILNSTPVRVFTAAYVNRTGAEYCAYFAWVIGLIPLPKGVMTGRATKLAKISKKIHDLRGRDEKLLANLDEIVSELYGLSIDDDLPEMQDFLRFFAS